MPSMSSTYTVRRGDSPASIAATLAGCPKCAKDLVDANPHKPSRTLPNGYRTFTSLGVGEVLRVPEKWTDGSLARLPPEYFAALPSHDGGLSGPFLNPMALSPTPVYVPVFPQAPPSPSNVSPQGPPTTTPQINEPIFTFIPPSPSPTPVAPLPQPGPPVRSPSPPVRAPSPPRQTPAAPPSTTGKTVAVVAVVAAVVGGAYLLFR